MPENRCSGSDSGGGEFGAHGSFPRSANRRRRPAERTRAVDRGDAGAFGTPLSESRGGTVTRPSLTSLSRRRSSSALLKASPARAIREHEPDRIACTWSDCASAHWFATGSRNSSGPTSTAFACILRRPLPSRSARAPSRGETRSTSPRVSMSRSRARDGAFSGTRLRTSSNSGAVECRTAPTPFRS